MAIWLVRAGKAGENEDYALANGVVVVGRAEDFSSVQDKDGMLAFLLGSRPGEKVNKLKNWHSQIWPFIKGMAIGDLVAMPLKQRPVIAFGKIEGPYRFDPAAPAGARNQRNVKWIREVPRTAIDQDLLYSLGAFMTVCRIWRNNAEIRLTALAESRPTPPASTKTAGDQDDTEAAEGAVDLDLIARDQIRNEVYAKFKGHGLARLVAAVLSTQGYRTSVAPGGPDGGVDVIAGMGSLGLDSPRLVVHVKSEQNPIDVKVIRELQGVMKSFGADHGLVVAWVGFKPSVLREAASRFFEIRLWSGDDLIDAMLESYNDLPPDIRADIPLKRIWTPVADAPE